MKLLTVTLFTAMTSFMCAEDVDVDKSHSDLNLILSNQRTNHRHFERIHERELSKTEEKLQSDLRKAAELRGVDIDSNRKLSRIENSNWDQVVVYFKVIGVQENVNEWVREIHSPRQLQVVRKMVFRPNEEDLSTVTVEVEVIKFVYRPEINNPLK